MVPKSGPVTVRKIENLYRQTLEKFTDSKNAIFFRSTTKNNEIIADNAFRTAASPGAWPS